MPSSTVGKAEYNTEPMQTQEAFRIGLRQAARVAVQRVLEDAMQEELTRVPRVASRTPCADAAAAWTTQWELPA